jgi:CMP-N,N'-diacetyllegionaminic acid synthase
MEIKMVNHHKLAIIPARSGSKGLKDKNIRLLNGKPLLAYSIEAAKASGIFDEIMLSTDSEEYARIGRMYGAKVPFLRSERTSSDNSTSWDAVREVLEGYEKSGKRFDIFTLLQPTSPLRGAENIRKAYQVYQEKNANAVIGVCAVDHSPLWCNTLPEDHSLCDFISKDIFQTPRQKLGTYYRINGGIYMLDVSYFKKAESIYESGCYAYIMDKIQSIDIDDIYDFLFAETIMREKEKSDEVL